MLLVALREDIIDPSEETLLFTVFAMDEWHRFLQPAMERIFHFQTEKLHLPRPVWGKGTGHTVTEHVPHGEGGLTSWLTFSKNKFSVV